MQEHFEKVIGRLRTLEGLVERLQTVESGGSGVKIVAVKYAEFTGTQATNVNAGATLNVTGLSIAHAMTKSTNKLFLIAHIGVLTQSNRDGRAGSAIYDGSNPILVGNAYSSAARVGSGTISSGSNASAGYLYNLAHITGVYSPGTTSSKTYTVRAINLDTSTKTIYVNRTESDTGAVAFARGYSSFVLFEFEGIS